MTATPRPFAHFNSNILALIGLLGLLASFCVDGPDATAQAAESQSPPDAMMVAGQP